MWCQNVSPKEFRVPPSALNPCQNQKGQCPPLLAAVIMKGSIIKNAMSAIPTHLSILPIPCLHGIDRWEGVTAIFGYPATPTCHFSDVLCDPIIVKSTTQHRVHLPTRVETHQSLHKRIHTWYSCLAHVDGWPTGYPKPPTSRFSSKSGFCPPSVHTQLYTCVALTSLAYTTNQGHTNQGPTIPTRMVSACSAQQCPGVLQCSHCVQLLCCPGYGGGMPPCRAACLHRHQTHPDPSPKIGKYNNQTRASPRPPVRQRMAFT